MISFKANVIIEFDSMCIKDARLKLKEITQEIIEEVPHVKKIYIDEKNERLFDQGDLNEN